MYMQKCGVCISMLHVWPCDVYLEFTDISSLIYVKYGCSNPCYLVGDSDFIGGKCMYIHPHMCMSSVWHI